MRFSGAGAGVLPEGWRATQASTPLGSWPASLSLRSRQGSPARAGRAKRSQTVPAALGNPSSGTGSNNVVVSGASMAFSVRVPDGSRNHSSWTARDDGSPPGAGACSANRGKARGKQAAHKEQSGNVTGKKRTSCVFLHDGTGVRGLNRNGAHGGRPWSRIATGLFCRY